MTTTDRPDPGLIGPRRPIRNMDRIRSWFWPATLALTAIALLAVLLTGLFAPHPTPPPLALSTRLPTVTREDPVLVTGHTLPGSNVIVTVDEQRHQPILVEPSGAYEVKIALGTVGQHRVELIVAYGSPTDPPDERLEGTITLLPASVPPPRVLAVEAEPNGAYRVLLATVTGTQVEARGATSTGPPDPRGPGRYLLEVTPVTGAAGGTTFVAIDATYSVSAPSAPVDLAAVADTTVPMDAADRTDADVSYVLDRDKVVRTTTVTIGSQRAELTELMEGRMPDGVFSENVVGRNGLTQTSTLDCQALRALVGSRRIEVGAQATVTFTDEFADPITILNGFSTSPQIAICFADGLPLAGDTGRLQITVRDFLLAGALPRPDVETTERLATGQENPVLTWFHLPRNGRVVLTLHTDLPMIVGLAPRVKIGDLLPDRRLGSFVSGLSYALIQGAAMFLLLWLVTTMRTSRYIERRRLDAASAITTVGAALALVPAVALVGDYFGAEVVGFVGARTSILSPVADTFNVASFDLGPVVVALGFAIVGAVFAGLARKANAAPVARLADGLGFAGLIWALLVGIGIAGVWLVTLGQVVSDDNVRAVAAVLGGSFVFFVALYVVIQVRRLQREDAPSTTGSRRALIAIVLLLAVGALVVAIPVGPDSLAATETGPNAFVKLLMHRLANIVEYGYALVAVAILGLLIRHTWGRLGWETIARESAVERLLERVGLVVFAGFVIGTAGVFAVLPIPFLLAAVGFRFLRRPAGDLDELARAAGPLRSIRLERVRQLVDAAAAKKDTGAAGPKSALSSQASLANPPLAAGESLALPATTSAIPATPPTIERPWPTELGPEPTIWGNIAFALKVGALATSALVVMYAFLTPLGTGDPRDPFPVQGSLLKVVAFAGSWLVASFFFGLMYETIRGDTGLRKGLVLGLFVLAFTLPFQLVTNLVAGLPLVSITTRVFQVLALTVVLGIAFDCRLLFHAGRFAWSSPGKALRDMSVLSGAPQIATGVATLAVALVATLTTLLTGQLTQLLTKIVSPFLPLPPGQ